MILRPVRLMSFAAVLMLGAATTALSAPATPWRSAAAETALFETRDFTGALQTASQTLVSLAPKAAGGAFDYLPAGRFTQRLGDGYYRIGDIDLRLRAVGDDAWHDYSTAVKRLPIKVLPHAKGVLAAADITGALGEGLPITVKRVWAVENGQLVLRFTLGNPGARAIEIGGLGLPMIFDNIITDRTLDQAHEQASFYDPYVGEDGGYLQVTRLNGAGPALLVLPEKNTPFELYKPILDHRNRDGSPVIYNDLQQRSMTFEGFYDWMVASKGFADTDWKGVKQWNAPSSLVLKPGETRTIGVRLVTSTSIRGIEDTLINNNRPVAVGVPGYIVPTDMPATLFVHSPKPVKAVAVAPEGALDIGPARPAAKGWIKYVLTGRTAGRVRLTLTYADSSVQTVQYLVTPPEQDVVDTMGHFLTTKQWFDVPNDPFHRSPSIMTYDRDEQKIDADDTRVWVSGLSDEGGAGSYLAAAMKEMDNPVPEEVAKFETFANQTLWGHIQVSDGAQKYGVHKSIFYYAPDQFPAGTYDPKKNWKTWESWNKEGADDPGRSYNYPHVAAAWWSLYHIARYHPGLATQQTWQTYLTRAAETTKAMMTDAPYYTQFGQMEGNVFVAILNDLKREGQNDESMTKEAATIEAMMKSRADQWVTQKYPFGSEMPWDSTGQSEVYDWMKYFGHDDKATSTREVILAYDPAIPHWGYNGSARRFWDFLYAGKKERIERQLHHYGSSNNAIPLFESYRDDPNDIYLLRVAYGGLMGSLSNIDGDGFGSAAFHSFPDMMSFDALSGDYGMSFFAHAYSTASYLVDHPTFGWIGFGGNVSQARGVVTLAPKDSARTRVFIAPAGLWLTLNAGRFDSVSYDPRTGQVSVQLAPAEAHTPQAFLDIATTTKDGKAYHLATPATAERGGYTIPLTAAGANLVLVPTTGQ